MWFLNHCLVELGLLSASNTVQSTLNSNFQDKGGLKMVSSKRDLSVNFFSPSYRSEGHESPTLEADKETLSLESQQFAWGY